MCRKGLNFIWKNKKNKKRKRIRPTDTTILQIWNSTSLFFCWIHTNRIQKIFKTVWQHLDTESNLMEGLVYVQNIYISESDFLEVLV
jgi:hypothetical protein